MRQESLKTEGERQPQALEKEYSGRREEYAFGDIVSSRVLQRRKIGQDYVLRILS
jgi:hypothetical protein